MRLKTPSTPGRCYPPRREGTTEIYGTSDAGRALVVIVAPALDGRWYVVTAREMTTNKRRAFRRKGR